MATKKSTKAPRKRAAPAADDHSSAASDEGADPSSRIHDAGEKLLTSLDPAEATSIAREAPDPAEAEAAAAEEQGSALALAVQRAMRFSTADEVLVSVSRANVIGASARGTIIVPWQAPALPERAVVVDGRKLHRCLRAAGPAAEIVVTTTRLEIRFGTRKFALSIMEGAELPILFPPSAGVAFAAFKPSVFRTAALFAGDDKVQPRELAGVSISAGGCLATDRRALICAFNATDNTGINLILPRDAFDGLSVDDKGEETVWLGVSPEGHGVIADPRTSEWRVVVGWGSAYPPVRDVLARWSAPVHVDADKAALVSALKQFRIVQSAGSSVKINVWTAPPTTQDGQPNPAAGDWLMLRGGDPGDVCAFEVRLGVRLHRANAPGADGIEGERGMRVVCVALDELLKLAMAFPGATVRLGIGAEREPVLAKTHVFEAGAMPMIDR